MQLSKEARFRVAVRMALAAGLLAPAALVPVYAQDDATPAKQEKPAATELKGITVTGSRVRRIEVEGPAPVQTITSEAITRSGYSTVQEVFDNLSANVGGSLGQNQTFGFTPGASGVDLRGFGVGRTLVLLDGRRLPVYPIAAGGSDNFVDLSWLPLEIIDRIEILKTGASAIYGSDAISGVINFITKKKYSGFSFTARAGGTERGGFGNERGQLSYGFKNDTNSFAIGAEYFHNDSLEAKDRSYSAHDVIPGRNNVIQNYSIFGASFLDFGNSVVEPSPNCGTAALPGTVPGIVNPTLTSLGFTGTVCGFDRATFRQLYPSIDRTSVYARVEHDFTFATGYAQGLYSNQTTAAHFEPFPYYSPLIPAGAPNNPGGAAGGSGYFYRRAIEFGGRGSNITNITRGLLVGLKGTFSDYEWDVSFARNQADSDDRHGSILKSALDNAVCGGGVSGGACTYSAGPGLNLQDPIPANVILASSYLRTAHAISQNSTFDAAINGPVGLKLPGGDIQFSFYAAGEFDEYSDINDPLTTSGQGIDGAVGASGKRRYAAGALEFQLPVLKNMPGAKELTFNVAGRYDRYFDKTALTGQFSPQITMAYRPISEVLLRASGSHTFRAPDLQRVFGGKTTGFEGAIDTPTCVTLGGTPGPDSPITECNTPVQSIPVVTSGNPTLKPEKGRNYGFGIVVEPIPDLTLSVDYFYIQLNNIVISPTAQFILNQCANTGALCNLIQRSPTGTLQGTGGALITENPLNASSQVERGIDYEARYGITVAPVGKFTFNFDATYLASLHLQTDPTTPDQQQLRFATFPRYRFTLSSNYERGPIGFTTTLHWVARVPGENNTVSPAPKSAYTSAYRKVNVQLYYDTGRYGLFRIGINNLFAQDTPVDPTGDNNQFAASTSSPGILYSDPFGREGYVQYEFKY